ARASSRSLTRPGTLWVRLCRGVGELVEPPHPVRRKAVVGDLETIPDAPQLHVETGLGCFDPHGLGPTEPFDASDDVRLNAHHNTRRHLARRGIAAVNGEIGRAHV